MHTHMNQSLLLKKKLLLTAIYSSLTQNLCKSSSLLHHSSSVVYSFGSSIRHSKIRSCWWSKRSAGKIAIGVCRYGFLIMFDVRHIVILHAVEVVLIWNTQLIFARCKPSLKFEIGKHIWFPKLVVVNSLLASASPHWQCSIEMCSNNRYGGAYKKLEIYICPIRRI